MKWSKKFIEKFTSIIPYINERLYGEKKRIKLTESVKELSSPKVRLSINYPFMNDITRSLEVNAKGEIFGIADTNSMEPLMDAGHKVLVVPFKNKDELQVGDIVVFDRGDHPLVIHRIIELKAEGIVTLGDNVVWKDQDFVTVNSEGEFTGKTLYTPYKKVKYICVGIIY